MIIFLISAFLSTAVNAQTRLSSKEKISSYESCMPSCITTQKTMAINKQFLDISFVIESFCSCSCARFVLRLPADVLEKVGRAKLEGRDASSIPEVRRVADRNLTVCANALFTD